MTTASAIRRIAGSAHRDQGQLRGHPRPNSRAALPLCRIGTRRRAYVTCHLAGCSTLKPRAGA